MTVILLAFFAFGFFAAGLGGQVVDAVPSVCQGPLHNPNCSMEGFIHISPLLPSLFYCPVLYPPSPPPLLLLLLPSVLLYYSILRFFFSIPFRCSSLLLT